VIIELEAQAIIYRFMCNTNSLTMVKIKSFRAWNINPWFVGIHNDTELRVS
jgi:hypothetical protein